MIKYNTNNYTQQYHKLLNKVYTNTDKQYITY